MSTHFHAWCGTCEQEGPQIRRSAGGTRLMTRQVSDLLGLSESTAAEAVDQEWTYWLMAHEYHDLRLFTERARPRPGAG